MSRSVLITGASRGIGAACARRFAAEGWDLALHYNTGKAEAIALGEECSRLGRRVELLRADLSAPGAGADLARAANAAFGRLDALVLNAGVAHQGLLTDTAPEVWDRLFQVNVTSVYECCRAALPPMIREHTGSIVTVSSMWGLTGASCEVAYSAAKAAVIGFSRALAKELGPAGIRVNCVAPGAVETDMLANLSDADKAALAEETPLGTLGSPEDIAQAVYFLASEQSRFVTGQVLSPNGGLVI